MLTLNTLYGIAYRKLALRSRIFDISNDKIRGNIENWVQWEIIEALEESGYKTELRGKIAKDCDIIVNDSIGIEIRTSPSGKLGYLEKAFLHNTDFYLFTFFNRPGSDAKRLFEEKVKKYTIKFKSGDLTTRNVLLVAER